MKRRAVLGWILGLGLLLISPMVWISGLPRLRFLRFKEDPGPQLDDKFIAELIPIAAVLLPKMPSTQYESIIRGFIAWLKARDPVGERDRITTEPVLTKDNYKDLPLDAKLSPIDPRVYPRQLRAFVSEFAPRKTSELGREELERRLRTNIEKSGIKFLPGKANGENLFVDLIAYFYDSSAALDMLYGRKIGIQTCRGLSGVEKAPLPL